MSTRSCLSSCLKIFSSCEQESHLTSLGFLVCAVKEDTEEIKAKYNLVIEEIQLLRLQVDELTHGDRSGGVMLQRFLDELTSYAESVVQDFDINQRPFSPQECMGVGEFFAEDEGDRVRNSFSGTDADALQPIPSPSQALPYALAHPKYIRRAAILSESSSMNIHNTNDTRLMNTCKNAEQAPNRDSKTPSKIFGNLKHVAKGYSIVQDYVANAIPG